MNKTDAFVQEHYSTGHSSIFCVNYDVNSWDFSVNSEEGKVYLDMGPGRGQYKVKSLDEMIALRNMIDELIKLNPKIE